MKKDQLILQSALKINLCKMWWLNEGAVYVTMLHSLVYRMMASNNSLYIDGC